MKHEWTHENVCMEYENFQTKNLHVHRARCTQCTQLVYTSLRYTCTAHSQQISRERVWSLVIVN